MTTLDEFVAEARAFLDGAAAKRSDGADAQGQARPDRVTLFSSSGRAEVERCRQWQRTIFDAGFGWITGPTEYGGRDLPAAFERAYLAMEREYDVPAKGALTISLGMVTPTLAAFGTAEAKDQWIRRLRRGDAVGCQLFSEPGAGSDLASVSTSATRDGEVWVLNGQKVWTSGAHYADLGLALTKTSNGDRHQNLTMFLVDMHSTGVEVRPLRQMTGRAEFNEVFLDGVIVPDNYRLGEVDGGWKVAMGTLGFERSAIGGSSSGGAGILKMDDLADWLHGLGCRDDPTVADMYARLYTRVSAGKAMRQTSANPALGKLLLTSNLTLLSDLVTVALGKQLVADTGNVRTFSWSEFVLGVPGMRIGGGTDEIMRNTVAERSLGLPREAR